MQSREELTRTEIGNTNYFPHIPIKYLVSADNCSIIGEMTKIERTQRQRYKKRL